MILPDHWHRTRRAPDEWTRGLPRTRLGAELRTKIVIGRPASGKSTARRSNIKDPAAARQFVMVQDLHGTLHDAVLADLAPRREQDIEVLDLEKPSAAFGVDVGRASDAPD